MACECEGARRRDRIGSPLAGAGNVRTATVRAAGAPLRYYRPDGSEAIEHAPAGDLGALEQPQVPIELGHGGPVIGTGREVARTSDALIVEMTITDAGALARIDSGEYPHVSGDYTIGRIDADGAQRGVTIHRIAVVPRGRCGEACAVRHDHSDACYDIPAPMKITIAGKEYAAGSPEAATAMAAESTRLDALGTSLAAGKSAALRTQVETAFPKLIVRKDALDPEILVAAIKQVAPGVDVSGQSDDYIAGAFAVAIAMALDLKGKAAEPGPDDAPAAADGAPKPPPASGAAAGANALRADVFQARATAAPKPAAKPAARELSPSEKARKDMIARGRAKS